jgi:hypothetical protein
MAKVLTQKNSGRQKNRIDGVGQYDWEEEAGGGSAPEAVILTSTKFRRIGKGTNPKGSIVSPGSVDGGDLSMTLSGAENFEIAPPFGVTQADSAQASPGVAVVTHGRTVMLLEAGLGEAAPAGGERLWLSAGAGGTATPVKPDVGGSWNVPVGWVEDASAYGTDSTVIAHFVVGLPELWPA